VRRGKAEEPLTGGGYHPRTRGTGIKDCYSGSNNQMIAAPGPPLLAAEARHDEVDRPGTAPALSGGTRYLVGAEYCVT